MKKLKAEDVLEYFHSVALAEAEPILRMAIKTVAGRKPLVTAKEPVKRRSPRRLKTPVLLPADPGESKSAD